MTKSLYMTFLVIAVAIVAVDECAGQLPQLDTAAPDSAGVEPGWRLKDSLTVNYGLRWPAFNATKPEFLKQPVLGQTYREGLRQRWFAASAGRTFEAEEKGLDAYSEIDIPIKFPSRIGRVIGQGANLSVSGSEQITFGGQTRYRLNEPETEFGKRSKFPTLDMKQHLKIDLTGTVGEKIHVMVHHDSDIETPLENRIKLRYEGDDDEIVQSIEMGNTNLSIPGSQFVSYSGKQEGLFGAKMLARVGALDIAAIASKQEGRTAGARFEGAATRDSVVLDDLDFVRHKYFYMIHPRDPMFAYPDKSFRRVVVYLDDGNGKNNESAVHGYAFLKPDPGLLPGPAAWDTLPYAYEGSFDILEANRDYAVDLRTGEVSLLRRLEATHTLAVTYVYGSGPDSVRAGGYEQDSLMLKMIRPRDEDMTQKWEIWGDALKYERKNVYSLQSTYISEEKVEVTIYRRAPELGDTEVQGDFKYSQVLGIDVRDETGAMACSKSGCNTDNYADGGRVNGELGLLIFPDLRPFAPEDPPMWVKPDGLPDLLDTNPVIYDTLYTYLKPQTSKYYMIVRFSTPQTTFKLPHINILENSEVVELNGNRLTRNVDYEIYYDIGQIRFKTEEAAEPDARISVDYQYVPFLSLAQQSLVGMQGIYRFSKDSHVGTAWLYQSKKSPEERPRLGQEPSTVVMGDVNANLQFNSDLLTSLVDGLPMVEAEKPSRITLSGELGMSFPNPNTKGDVYIDDMEGVKDLRSFSVMREAWVPASPPTGLPADLRWQDTRRIWWYVKDDEVKEEDLFPNAESKFGEGKIPVLEINFKDYRYSQDFVTSDPMNDWGGLMRLVSKSGSDYSELKYVEVWLRQKQGDGGMMHIDLGALSENYYNPWEADSLHDEDKDNDGQLSTSENTGLDGVFTGKDGDDPYDDWGYTEGDYSRINGTEKDSRIVPDTEDLDGDGNLDTDEVHFRLSFDLADETYIVNEAAHGWRQYRIPLADAQTNGSPSWRSVKYIRFYFTEIDSPAVFQVAYLQIAGASWLDEGIRNKKNMAWLPDRPPEEKFEISAKNTRDDPDYDPPYDPGTDPDGYKKREQSLVFNIKNLQAGHSGSVYRLLPGQANDYTLYKTLAFYVHGDQAAASESLYMFVRFGADSLNFYEYATRIRPGWRTIEVPLEEVTNAKMEDVRRDSIYKREVDLCERTTGDGWIRVYGGPSITRVSRISAGIVNQRNDGLASSDSVEVWFDDLRLTDVRKEAGFAKRVSVGASLSDVVTVNADIKQTDTEFQTLSGKRRGSDDTDYSVSLSTGIDRFMPDLGLSLPFSMRYHKSQSLPTLRSKSDIALKPEERKDEEKYSVDDSYRLAFSRRGKSKNPFLRLTLDALSGNISYSANRGRSPDLENDSYGYAGGVGYNFSPWWGHSLRIFRGYMISYLPENVTANVSGTARTTRRVRIDDSTRTTLEDRYARDVKGAFSISFKPFSGPSIETDYSLKTTRDLDLAKKLPLSTSIGRGRELTRSQKAGVRIKRAFGKWMRPTLSYDVNYDENADPKIKSAGDPGGVRRASVSNRSRFDVVFTPGSVFSDSRRPGDTTGVALHALILSKIPDITAGYVIDRSSKYNKLMGRPPLKFQLGLEPEVDEALVLLPSSGAAQPTDEFTRKDGINFSTEFRPLSSLSLDTKYKYDKSLRTYAGSKTFNETAIWPDITGNISSLASVSFLQGVLKSSSLVVGYKGTTTARGVGTSEATNRTDKSEWVPLIGWDATWNNGVRTTFNLRRSTADTENLQGTRSLQRTKTTSIDVSVRHSFSAPQGMYIPLAGRTLRFKSNLTVSVDVSFESVYGTTPTLKNRVDRDSRKFAILPKASYSFSKNITGSANITFRQDSDRKLGQTYRTIGVSASVLIRF